MGYARIILNVEQDKRKYSGHMSSDQALNKLEKQLRKDGLLFVEDYETVITPAEHTERCSNNEDCPYHKASRQDIVTVRWGNSLTFTEVAELQEELT